MFDRKIENIFQHNETQSITCERDTTKRVQWTRPREHEIKMFTPCEKNPSINK